MVKAHALLKAGEEEWWLNRHPSPILFPWSEGGVAFQRNRKHNMAGTILQSWRPEDRARYPDVFERYEKLTKLRFDSWEDELQRVDEADEATEEKGETITDALPAAKEVDGLPPFWWGHATRGFERAEVMHWDWMDKELHN